MYMHTMIFFTYCDYFGPGLSIKIQPMISLAWTQTRESSRLIGVGGVSGLTLCCETVILPVEKAIIQ